MHACACVVQQGRVSPPRRTSRVKYALGVRVMLGLAVTKADHLHPVLLLGASNSWTQADARLQMSKMSNPVITHQPGSGGYGTNVQTGEWSTGLCSCCTDFFVCECSPKCLKPWFSSCVVFHKVPLCTRRCYWLRLPHDFKLLHG